MKKMLSLVLASSITLGSLGVLPVCAAEAKTAAPSAIETTVANPVSVETNVFKVLGYSNMLDLKIVFDAENMKLTATGRAQPAHWGFYDDEYFRVEIKSIYGFIMFSEGVTGNMHTIDIANKLNKFVLQEGDIIYIRHKEAGGRLKVDGLVTDAPTDLSQGMNPIKDTYTKAIGFKVTKDGLVYKGIS